VEVGVGEDGLGLARVGEHRGEAEGEVTGAEVADFKKADEEFREVDAGVEEAGGGELGVGGGGERGVFEEEGAVGFKGGGGEGEEDARAGELVLEDGGERAGEGVVARGEQVDLDGGNKREPEPKKPEEAKAEAAQDGTKEFHGA
jgi:hypothetical protein